MNAAITDVATHSQVKDDQLCQTDHQCAILLRIPTPESTPRVVGPDTTQNRADDTEEETETECSVDHASQTFVVTRV